MNYIRHLSAFFNIAKNDNRLTAMHVSLYIALFQYWNFNRFQNPFKIYRDDIMKMSRIGSKNTYHKCIKQLHITGYILQHKSTAKYSPSKISIIRLDKKEENLLQQLVLFSPTFDTAHVPNLTNTNPNNDTDSVANLGHLLKHINNKPINEENSHAIIFEKNWGVEKTNELASVPNVGQVESFFQQNNYPSPEAQKFFHHYQSNGWLIAGKTKMKDWQSSAHKWMLNAKDFTKNNNHNLSNNKDYSQPL